MHQFVRVPIYKSSPVNLIDKAQNVAEADFPIFALELEREIILLAVRTYRGVSTRLMFVASRVKSYWLFLFLTGRIHACHIQDRTFRAQDSPAWKETCSPISWRTHKWFVSPVHHDPCQTDYPTFHYVFRAREPRSPDPPQIHTADLVGLLSALPLSLNLTSIKPFAYWQPPLKNYPVFVNLTHLDIMDHQCMLWTSIHGIECLPFLTHVSFRFWSRGSVRGRIFPTSRGKNS